MSKDCSFTLLTFDKKSTLMNTVLWISQVFLAIVFMYSGFMKSTQSERKLVEIGQTGVEGLPMLFIRFIGISELAGAIGLVVPWLINTLPVLSPLSAICLGVIMVPAARIHYKRNEMRCVLQNAFFLLLCLFVAYGRLAALPLYR
jgi:uncharacterized membrane protein YphA (DoxX/SURF4 family)